MSEPFVRTSLAANRSIAHAVSTGVEAAADGIAATATDPKAVDTAIKAFGGFDRNTFKMSTGDEAGLLKGVVSWRVMDSASVLPPAKFFKQVSSQGEQSIFLHKNVLKNMEDPKFNIADGLASYAKTGVANIADKDGLISTLPEPLPMPRPDDPNLQNVQGAYDALKAMETTVNDVLNLYKDVDFASGVQRSGFGFVE